jgi:hypothetical protein
LSRMVQDASIVGGELGNYIRDVITTAKKIINKPNYDHVTWTAVRDRRTGTDPVRLHPGRDGLLSNSPSNARTGLGLGSPSRPDCRPDRTMENTGPVPPRPPLS